MCVALTSLKGGISQKNPDHRAVHRHSTHEVYPCTLSLVAARSRVGAYKSKVAPFLEDLGVGPSSTNAQTHGRLHWAIYRNGGYKEN